MGLYKRTHKKTYKKTYKKITEYVMFQVIILKQPLIIKLIKVII